LPEPANSLAYFLAEDGRDLETALKWAQTARRVNPENPNYADTLGWVQHKLGRNVLARDQLQFAVSKQPDQPLYQYHLAVVYKETGQPEQAKAALKKALSSGRNFSERTLAEAALKELGGVK
jgi:predicted Zn-dependent protease